MFLICGLKLISYSEGMGSSKIKNVRVNYL